MAKSTTLTLAIKIAGRMDKSLNATLSGASSLVGNVAGTMSRIGTAGLAAMGTFAAGTIAAIKDCTDVAVEFEQQMSDVTKYVGGLADENGQISDKVAQNGKTFAENYEYMKDSILELSTTVPYTAEDLTRLAAAAGQSGKSMDEIINGGFLRDVAKWGTAMDISADQAGDWAAKWEKSFNMDHDEIMVLADQINYLGANSATTAAEIAEAVNSSASLGQIAGVDVSTTAALADAMLATGVASGRVGTTIKRTYTNLMKGSSATKTMKDQWAELGLTAEGVAESMVKDSTGTMLDIFQRIGALPQEKQVAALSNLLGQWAIEGGAKVVGNLDTFTDALKMVNDPSLYTGSMEREFAIKSDTAAAAETMRANAKEQFQVHIGDAFLPLKKQIDLSMRDLWVQLDEDMPQLKELAGTLADLASKGVTKIGDAIEKALPHVQRFLDYISENGDQVADILKKVVLALIGMKFAPAITGVAGGAAKLVTNTVFGNRVGGSVAPGMPKRRGGLMGIFRSGQNAVGRVRNLGQAASAGAALAEEAEARGPTSRPTVLGRVIGGVMGMQNASVITGATRGRRYSRLRNEITGAVSGPGGARGFLQDRFNQSFAGRLTTSARDFGAAVSLAGETPVGQGVQRAGRAVGRGVHRVGGMMNEILTGIAGPEGLGITSGIQHIREFGQYAGGRLREGATALGGRVAAGAQNLGGRIMANPVVSGAMGLAQRVAASPVGNAVRAAPGAIAASAPALGEVASTGGTLLKTAWGPMAGMFGSLASGAVPVVGAISGVIAIVSILGDHLDGIRNIIEKIFGEKGVAVFDNFTGFLGGIKDKISGLFNPDNVASGMEGLKEKIMPVLSNIFGEDFANQFGEFFSALTPIVQPIMGFLGQIVDFANTTVKPIIEQVFGFITQTVMPKLIDIFQAAAPVIGDILGGLGNAIMGVMQFIGDAIQTVAPYVEAFISGFLDIAERVIPVLLEAFDVFVQALTPIIENVQGIFNGIIDFIKNVFTGNWEGAWNAVKDIFGNIFDLLGNLIKTPINAVIKIINGALEGINGIHIKVPDWVPGLGGEDFGFNIPLIPELAKGGFTTGPSIAGEAGQEAVISFQRAERAANIATWMRAGQMLGVTNRDVMSSVTPNLKEIPDEGYSDHNVITINYSPQVVIQGNASRDDIDAALAQAKDEFGAYIENLCVQARRRKY